MRNKEQFKEYVYKKANERIALQRIHRIRMFRGVATFSFIFIVCGLFIYSSINSDSSKENAAPEVAAYGDFQTEAQNEKSVFGGYSLFNDSMEQEAIDICEKKQYPETLYSKTDDTESVTTSTITVGTFNYRNERDSIENNTPGVKTNGFVNVLSVSIENEYDIISRALNECTIAYNMTDVFYDETTDVWKVVFYRNNTIGNCQSVYINGDGTTCLIIYGE